MDFEAFTHAVAATTSVPFVTSLPTLPHGIANGLLVTATLSSGITLTLADNVTTVALGNQTIGTYLRFRCTKAAFAAGGVVAYA